MPTPRTYLVGITQPDLVGITKYLNDTDQSSFLEVWQDAVLSGTPQPLCLVSFYAKLCYKSLVSGKNQNVTKVRDIEENIKGCFASGHGSVFEHVQLNFITTNCSRVFTHELVRHRVGTAFSQTSGRYCTVEDAELVLPPDLEDAINELDLDQGSIADEMRDSLGQLKQDVARWRKILKLDDPATPFAVKKKLTSALRRIMPNGATNEIGWSCNVRSLRHMIEMRTSRHAEWEIRVVFAEVARLVQERWPLMLHNGKCEIVEGLLEWTGLKV